MHSTPSLYSLHRSNSSEDYRYGMLTFILLRLTIDVERGKYRKTKKQKRKLLKWPIYAL